MDNKSTFPMANDGNRSVNLSRQTRHQVLYGLVRRQMQWRENEGDTHSVTMRYDEMSRQTRHQVLYGLVRRRKQQLRSERDTSPVQNLREPRGINKVQRVVSRLMTKSLSRFKMQFAKKPKNPV